MALLTELRRRWWLVLLLAVLLVLVFGQRVAIFYTDILWYQSIGFARVFWTLLGTQFGLGVGAAVLMTILVAANLLLARRLAPSYRIPTVGEEGIERYRQVIEPYARPLALVAAVFVGVLSGLSIAPQWPRFVLWANAVDFGRVDPQFGRDLGFFVFSLPFLMLVNSWLFTGLVLTILLTAFGHYVFGGIRPQSPGQKLTPQVNVHLSVLLAALVGVRAWGFWLDRYQLSYSERGEVTGLSYTDVNAQLVAFQLLAIIGVVCVLLFLANIFVRGWLLPTAGVGILLVAAVVLSGVYPAVIQRLQVDPQELDRERPYIERNLEFTRFGYDLQGVDFEQFPANAELSAQEVDDNIATLESIRLWDPETLQNTYKQLQVLRPYYDFADVDVDRYEIDGELRQVMIGVRELSPEDLPSGTWQNKALTYTHGFGVVASAVSSKSNDGQPVFYVKDIPPNGVSELEIENPRIYFGENPPTYSIVNAADDELDYVTPDDEPVRFRYDGADGVKVGAPLRRLAFALRYAEPNLLLSSLITDESKILYRREIRDRVQAVAPYLELDQDPYPVAVDGRVQWILDAYTTSDMLPYSERLDLAELTAEQQQVIGPVQQQDGSLTFEQRLVPIEGIGGRANYIRNSVKAVVDAYSGTITLYVVEPDDPVLQAWRGVFPESFTDLDEASDALIDHFRYPEDLFRIQSDVFRTYHIQAPGEFYTKEDAWEIPEDAAFAQNSPPNQTQQRRRMLPYYLNMKLPGENQEEFALIQPFTPASRDVMTAWLAGRSDGENYGELRAYVMPSNRTVFGPEQIQARVDQDDAVSQQITLWNQSGSRVIYGNLLVIPVGDSLLYAQPLFLAGTESEIPQLQRVVLVFGDNVVMEETLQEGLDRIFGEDAIAGLDLPADADEGATDPDEGDPGEQIDPGAATGVDPQLGALLEQALQAFGEADAALREGDLATYQERTDEAQRLLEQARSLFPSTTPLPQDEPTPGAPSEPASP